VGKKRGKRKKRRNFLAAKKRKRLIKLANRKGKMGKAR